MTNWTFRVTRCRANKKFHLKELEHRGTTSEEKTFPPHDDQKQYIYIYIYFKRIYIVQC